MQQGSDWSMYPSVSNSRCMAKEVAEEKAGHGVEHSPCIARNKDLGHPM